MVWLWFSSWEFPIELHFRFEGDKKGIKVKVEGLPKVKLYFRFPSIFEYNSCLLFQSYTKLSKVDTTVYTVVCTVVVLDNSSFFCLRCFRMSHTNLGMRCIFLCIYS